MAYFSNGSEGQDYEARWCNRCVHEGGPNGPGCAVWLAHLMHNSDQVKGSPLESTLAILIPVDARGFALKCKMFLTVEDVRRARLARSRKPLLESAHVQAREAEGSADTPSTRGPVAPAGAPAARRDGPAIRGLSGA